MTLSTKLMPTELDPAQFLTAQFLERKEINPTYSLRSFATEIGVSVTQLSRVLSGQRSMSYRQMSKVLSALNTPDEVSQKIISGIILKASKTAKVSNQLRGIVLSTSKRNDIQPVSATYLPADRFKMISQWYHLAILELTYLENFDSNPAWIAKTLNISLIESKDAIARLLDLGFLKQDEQGVLSKADSTILFKTKRADPEFKKYDTVMLEKAKQELDKTNEADFQMRLINSITFPTSPDSLPELKAAIVDFQKKILTLIKDHDYTQVYHFGCQLFPVSKNHSPSEEKA